MQQDSEKILEILARMEKEQPISTFRKLSFFPTGGDIVGNLVSIDNAFNWLSQFDDSDIYTALQILMHITYINPSDYILMCRIALLLLQQSENMNLSRSLFIPVGEISKSGHLMSYFFRISNRLSASIFKSISNLDKKLLNNYDFLIFLDDFVGTGRQFSNWWNNNNFIQNLNRKIKQYYITLIGTSSGIRHINENTNVTVLTVHERWEHRDWDPIPESDIYNLSKKYGEGLFITKGKDHFLGYEECRSSIVFFYNVPNNTLPIIWASGINKLGQRWEPLVRRKNEEHINPISALNLIIDKIYIKDKMSEEDIVNICEFITDLRSKNDLEKIPIRDMVKLIELISDFYNYLSGGTGIHPPKFADFFIKMREWLISIISDKIIKAKIPNIIPLIKLFKCEAYTISQNAFIGADLHKQILRVMSNSNQIYLFKQKKQLLKSICDINGWISEGAFRICKEIINKRLFGSFHIDEVSKLKTSNIQAEYYKLNLMASIDNKFQETLNNFLTDEVKKNIKFSLNLYGKMRILSLKDAEDFNH